MDIPSIRIPTINIPGLKVLSGFTFPPQLSNTTWFIIVFVIGMFLLSCMSNRCGEGFEGFEDPINRFEHVHYDGHPISSCGHGRDCTCQTGLHADRANPLDYTPYGPHGTHPSHHGIVERFTNNGRDFEQPAYTSCAMKTNCIPGERDIGDYCVKEGCPSGMERGAGVGADFCYPTCAPGYEADGGGRCYKTCQDGWITQGDKCIRPKHEFKKDTMPCKGCLPPTLPTPQLNIPIIEIGDGPVWMTQPIVQTRVTSHTHNGNGNGNGNGTEPHQHGHEHNTETTFTYPSARHTMEYFGTDNSFNPQPIIDNIQSDHQLKLEGFQPILDNIDSDHGGCGYLEPAQTNNIALIEHMADTATKASTSKDHTTRKTWRVEDRIFVNELACPLGYTQSGDNLCIENCPPQYEDTGASCILHRHSIPRPTYDRGSGVPYSTKKSKYKNINPVQQCR